MGVVNWKDRVYFFITEDMTEPVYRLPQGKYKPAKKRALRWHYKYVERPFGWLWCKIIGHHAITDHCGLPAHDLCGWCLLPMPGQATRTTPGRNQK